MKSIRVIIPAFNEENSIGKVIRDIPRNLVQEIIVVNNNSTDNTRQNANSEGVTVLNEPMQGYGNACLKGLDYIEQHAPKTEIIVFIDADYSDYPQEMNHLIKPIVEKDYDMVIGSRKLGNREPGSMTFPQVFGNWLATFLLKVLYKKKFTDLGPFRAIKFNKLKQLNMQDRNYGWTVEMQVKAAKHNLSYGEVPVSYRKRIGKSKVSGTVRGTISAGYKIIWTIFKYL